MGQSGTGEVEGGRHVSASMIAALLRYVERVSGGDAVGEVLDRSGVTASLEEVTSLSGWISHDEACAIFEAARDVLDDPEVGFRAGEEMLRQHAGTEVAALLRSLGSPSELLRNIAATSPKYSTVTHLEAVDVSDTGATITAEARPGFIRHRLLCDYTAGILSQAPPLFGLDAAVVEEVQCQGRGAPRCVYDVRWNQTSAQETAPEVRIEQLEHQLAAVTARFESLQETAAEMVTATDVEVLLSPIAARAGLAVRAPAHMLVVRLPGERDLRIHGAGVPVKDQERLARELLDGDPATMGDGRLVVDVATGHQHYGRLAALYGAGTAFFAQERRLLVAFASQAAAALSTATVLQDVTRRNQTARDLLGLASELAQVTTRQEAANRIADVVPRIVDCDTASVFLWDAEAQQLSMRACAGLPERVARMLRTVVLSPEDTPLLQGSLLGRQPFVLDVGHGDPFLRGLLQVTEQEAVAVVPIHAPHQFFGVVTAGVASGGERLASNEHALERLQGLAAHAASALRNAQLLDEVSYRAVHDPLTGLPNRSLLRDRLTQALASARRSGRKVGVLIVDLDGFKQVNDTHGHTTGDAVIVAAAHRLRGALRASDTIARTGGDEFAIVLPEVTGGEECQTVAKKLLDELRQPISYEGHTFRITASIGGIAGAASDGFDSLIRRADAAMYEAKEAGRNTSAQAGE